MHSPVHRESSRPRAGTRAAGLAGGLFAAWAVSLTVLVAALARAGCATVTEPGEVASVPAGWTLHHHLDSRDADARRVAALLLERGPRPDGRETVVIPGGDVFLRAQFEERGWEVSAITPDDPDLAPRLRVIAPDGRVAWTGRFNPADLQTPGSLMLDRVVLAEVAAGRLPPPIVPVACALPADSD